jgi:hypothetical protein
MKQCKRKELPYECIIDVYYMPFPSDEAKKEAYYTNAKLFLRAKERAVKESYIKPSVDKKGRQMPSSFY